MGALSKIALGDKFGMLTIVGQAEGGLYGSRRWKCLCACGKTVIRTSSDLGARPNKSCGCVRFHKLKEGEACLNVIYSRYLKRDLTASRDSDLTKEEFQKLTSSQCFYCNLPPSQVLEIPGSRGSYTYNGIDRVNNDLGYTKENTVPCCKTCNWMKVNMSQSDFVAHVKTIAIHLQVWK